MAFPPNYRQTRQDRTRAKDKKSREKEARREERRLRKSVQTAEQPSSTAVDRDKQ